MTWWHIPKAGILSHRIEGMGSHTINLVHSNFMRQDGRLFSYF